MILENGYEMESTFPMDFTIAEKFGLNAVKDTFNRAFREWKNNYVYLMELVITLNLKLWYWWNKNGDCQMARLYNDLWGQADLYATENLKDEELKFFLRTTD